MRRSGHEKNVDHTISNIKNYLGERNAQASRLIWLAIIKAKPEAATACFRPNKQKQLRKAESTLVHLLKTHEWIPTKTGEFKKPAAMSRNELLKQFPYDDQNGLLTAIGLGEEEKKRSEEYKARDDEAKKLGWKSAEDLEKVGELIRSGRLSVKEIESLASQKENLYSPNSLPRIRNVGTSIDVRRRSMPPAKNL